ncbi:Suppressor of variegation 4-20 [Fasciola hepatica]|uniref:Suppressor of variegation 4-20 n=1 Tax=Fasciola hepatica TaxID=6192 RepID=A0A4E0R185_FASHE|nr:Suppressor of variegation 4-20 [Fasciola hepatica]
MNTTKKKSSIPIITGYHRMTWRELAEADDLASALTVDVMLGFVTHKMTEMKLRITERIKTKFRETIVAFQKHKCYETAFDQLTADSNIVRRSWRSDLRFKEHVFRYLLLFDDRSGVEIRPCMRYASENHVGAAIFASKDWYVYQL